MRALPEYRRSTPGEYLRVWRGVVWPVGQARDSFERESGWAAGWLRSRARESLAQTSTTASESWADLLVDTQADGSGSVVPLGNTLPPWLCWPLSVKMVFCPTKYVVASYLFRSAKTGASASRECSSCEGFGPLAFMNTTKCVSDVKRDIWPFASRPSALRVCFHELPDSETIRGFFRGDGNVFHRTSISIRESIRTK